MKGAPYSAETVVESSQTLPDGNRINRKTTGRSIATAKAARAARRTSTSRTATPNGFVSSVRKTISIVDPVAGFSYSLDPRRLPADGHWRRQRHHGQGGDVASERADEREALWRRRWRPRESRSTGERPGPTPADRAGAGWWWRRPRRCGGAGRARRRRVRWSPRGAADARRGGAARRPLEHKTIEGVAVEGRKTTTVIPAGQVGNEQPITIAQLLSAGPMRQVQPGWNVVVPRSVAAARNSSSLCTFGPGKSS